MIPFLRIEGRAIENASIYINIKTFVRRRMKRLLTF
jgi:hypothetical protein